MLSESDIHDLLARFGPNIIALLDSIDFWEIAGEYNPSDLITELKQQPEYKQYVKESVAKNSRVWDLVKVLFVPTAINAGLNLIKKDYAPQIAKAKAPTAQDYQEKYIKEHGGEFITNMSRADQKQLTRFLWKNSGEHERPLAKMILKQEPTLAYLVDNKEYRLRAIKRTEIGRATRYGAWKYAASWGAKTKTRHSAFRPTSRESHKAISGEEVPIDKPYSNGEMFCKENSINCLCWDTFNF